MSRLESIEIGNHLIAIYDNKDEKFREALEFLGLGIERNEVMMLLTEQLTKEEVREKMRDTWKVDVEKLEAAGDVIIKTNSEWYFPDGIPNTMRTYSLYKTLVEECIQSGKKGLRVVGDCSAFFDHSLSRELLDYELDLDRRFSFPMSALCAYDAENLTDHFTEEEIESLKSHHSILLV